MNLSDYKKKYEQIDIITFGGTIKHKYENDRWKFIYTEQPTSKYISPSNNCLCIPTGKINNLFVLEILDIASWNQLLIKHNKKEPKTIKVVSQNGDMYLYFKYETRFEDIRTSLYCISSKYAINIKTNDGFIIAPPSSCYNEILKKTVVKNYER